MTDILPWISLSATMGIVAFYEVLLLKSRNCQGRPRMLAPSAHALLREDWFNALMGQEGLEIVGVQTLRNALMAATMIASTAALGLMGTVTLAAPSLSSVLNTLPERPFSPRLAAELILLAMLFVSLVASSMAVRYYKHVGFIVGMPSASEARRRWAATGAAYVRRAGMLYSTGLRHLVLVAPCLAFILYPLSGVIAAALAVFVLHRFDSAIPVERDET